MSKLSKSIVVYLPDTRAVDIARFGRGNLKLGADVFTYSRLAEVTCPGATSECLNICYAKRIGGPVREVYAGNGVADVPPIPDECRVLRIHVSGDFDSVEYIDNWVARITERPDVTCWAYTRSWRVPALLAAMERLRALPNVQVFASMDSSHADVPPAGWRRAWIDGDPRAGEPANVRAHEDTFVKRNSATFDGAFAYICPEETKHKANCKDCGYCFDGKSNDVTFLRH